MKIKLFVFIISTAALVSCNKSNHSTYQGYVEGELIYIASPYSGTLINLLVHRGERVKRKELLFELDPSPQNLIIQEAEKQLLQAKSIYKDLQNPKREPEISAIQAQIGQTEAQLELAKIRVQRYRKLYERRATTKDLLDQTVARYEELVHAKERYLSNLKLAMEGSRTERIRAQEAQVQALAAKLEEAQWQLAQKKLFAPASGVVFDTYYIEGEFVSAQKPVVSLLTPENIRIEFFVPERTLARLSLGKKVIFNCEGCDQATTATITYISPEAEYAPPLIYSRENSDKLVFRIKATFKDPLAFKPGQPVTVDINL